MKKTVLLLAASAGLIGLAATLYSHSRQRSSKPCRPLSTRSYRSQQKQRGRDVTLLEVDHIVPRVWGGADDPANYQLLPVSENRRLGSSWGPAKCASVGKRRCKAAIEVSTRCGTYLERW